MGFFGPNVGQRYELAAPHSITSSARASRVGGTSRPSALDLDLVTELDGPFGIYEIVDGKPHWRRDRFVDYVRRNHMTWLTHPDGSLDERDQAFREMEGKYPHIAPLRELRYSLSKLRLSVRRVVWKNGALPVSSARIFISEIVCSMVELMPRHVRDPANE